MTDKKIKGVVRKAVTNFGTFDRHEEIESLFDVSFDDPDFASVSVELNAILSSHEITKYEFDDFAIAILVSPHEALVYQILSDDGNLVFIEVLYITTYDAKKVEIKGKKKVMSFFKEKISEFTDKFLTVDNDFDICEISIDKFKSDINS